MPYKDPSKRKAAQREAQARRRGSTPRQPLPALAHLRLETARDVLAVLGEELRLVKADVQLGTVDRARTVALLCGGLLRAFEAADLRERLEALEARLEAQGGLRLVGGGE